MNGVCLLGFLQGLCTCADTSTLLGGREQEPLVFDIFIYHQVLIKSQAKNLRSQEKQQQQKSRIMYWSRNVRDKAK